MSTNVIPLTKEDLSIMSSTTQGVDNQYVPLAGLKKMEKQKLSREEYRKKIKKDIEAEFKRALLYSDSVVINRAFIINTEELYKPLLSSGDEKKAYLDLVKSKGIIPYLYNEKSITEGDASGYTKRDSGTMAVAELERELEKVPCVRFSWDEQQNLKDANRSARAFTSYIMSARIVANEIAADLKIKDVEGFKKKLNEVTTFCTETFDETKRDLITRQQLYIRFVCVEGRTKEESSQNVIQGKYDYSKKFWKELKMIFDLKYQANSADGLRIQTLSGRDLPERSALHELDMAMELAPASESIDLSTMFGEIVFSKLTNALWIRTVNDLTFSDIHKIRQDCDEYKIFLESAKKLKLDTQSMIDDLQKSKKGVDFALDFKSFINGFYNYQNAIRKITSARSAENIRPAIKVVINIGGVLLTVLADDKLVKLSGATAGVLSDQAATVISKVVAGASKNVDLAINYNFMRTRISNARDEYERLLNKFRKQGFNVVADKQDKQEEATIATQNELTYPEV
ncbi:MAG: hypothetical protein KJZ77_18435 [Anaerolineales bacterium]|nr:hypothetical protein [Anaerolineales bacterium]